MKRIFILLLSAALLLSLFSGCDQEDTPYVPTGDALDSGDVTTAAPESGEQELTLAYYPDRSLNPYTATDLTNRTLLPLMYQGMFAVDWNYEVTPILCRSYTVSPDMKTYTFTLCSAWFSDGTSITPQDVVASYAAARDGGFYAGRFQHITSVYAEGDTVVIRLDTPCENLPILLDIPIVKAAEAYGANPLGSGPYVLTDSADGKALKRQTAWWCNRTIAVTAAYIPLVAAESVSQIRDQFEFSEVGLVCTDPGSDAYAEYRCDYEIWNCENGLFLYLVCNADSQVFSNDTLRSSLTHAIDRGALAEEFYRGFADAAVLPASPSSPWYSQSLAGRYGYDSEKFTAALTETGLLGEQITLAVNGGDSLRVRVAEYIAAQLTECGLTTTVVEVPADEFAEYLQEEYYDLYLGQTRLSANMDLSAFFGEEGSLNYGGLADVTTYTMALDALANSGNYYNLHEQVMEDGWLCPLVFRSYAVYAARGLITSLTPARDNVFYYHTGRTMQDALVTE